MKKVKRRLEQFVYYDYKGLERHLERMALKGWRLHKITRFCWEYRKTEPRKLTFNVTYFSEASEFNPYPTENQHTFYEYCKGAGWDLVAEWAQMQIFCTQQQNPTPIETDESVKLKAIHRAMKKNFLPSCVLLLILSLFQIYLQFHTITDNPVSLLSNSTLFFAAAIWMILAVQMLASLIGYAVWYCRSKRAVGIGGACAKCSAACKKASYFLWLLTAVAIVLTVLSISSQRLIWAGILGIANMTLLIALVLAIKNALKRAEASRKVNLTVTIASCVILSIILTGVMTRCIVGGINAGWAGNHKPAETYTAALPDGSTHTWDIYRDPLPLKVEDLQKVDYEHYSYKWTARESFLLSWYIARQDSFPDGQIAPELRYSIVDVKWPALFDLCLHDYLDMYGWEGSKEDKRYFRQTDDPAWQADAVYQRYRQDDAEDEYILCWDNRIVCISFDGIPTTRQIAVAAEKLSK